MHETYGRGGCDEGSGRYEHRGSCGAACSEQARETCGDAMEHVDLSVDGEIEPEEADDHNLVVPKAA